MSSITQIAFDKEELRSLIADVLELDVEEVTDDADFVQDLEVDSLMALAIVFRLEKQYGVKLEESDLKQVSSLIQVLQLITDKRTAQAAS
ncbi:acyl carrier protein [Streptomyces sp. NBC_01003]|uniref:acyl carrier protein n=1 Tax=Streptomyces sp. NBC_01003 TaxID=2903714 RepID=UPI0038701B67|nr:acyl carrier protein [Streptomyces sp. NBC_01003]